MLRGSTTTVTQTTTKGSNYPVSPSRKTNHKRLSSSSLLTQQQQQKRMREVDVIAPANLNEGFVFWATITGGSKKHSFPVTVPKGGIKYGQIIRVTIPTNKEEEEQQQQQLSSTNTNTTTNHYYGQSDNTTKAFFSRCRNRHTTTTTTAPGSSTTQKMETGCGGGNNKTTTTGSSSPTVISSKDEEKNLTTTTFIKNHHPTKQRIKKDNPSSPTRKVIMKGQWKDGICSCFKFGLCHPVICNAWLCPQLLLGQILARMNMTWLAKSDTTSSSEKKTSMKSTFHKIMVLLIIFTVYDAIMAPPIVKLDMNENGEYVLIVDDPTSTNSNEENSAGLYYFWHQLIYGIMGLPTTIYGIMLVVKLRKAIRAKYNIPTGCLGDRIEDFCCVCLCNCCVLAQMARQTANYNEKDIDSNDDDTSIIEASWCSVNGIKSKKKKQQQSYKSYFYNVYNNIYTIIRRNNNNKKTKALVGTTATIASPPTSMNSNLSSSSSLLLFEQQQCNCNDTNCNSYNYNQNLSPSSSYSNYYDSQQQQQHPTIIHKLSLSSTDDSSTSGTTAETATFTTTTNDNYVDEIESIISTGSTGTTCSDSYPSSLLSSPSSSLSSSSSSI